MFRLKLSSTHIFTAEEVQSHPDALLSKKNLSRIGPVPNLSLTPPIQTSSANNASRVDPSRARTAETVPVAATVDSYGHARSNSLGAFNTLPAGSSSAAKPLTTDEFGYGVGAGHGTGRADGLGSIKPTLPSTTVSSVTSAATVSAQPTATSSGSTVPGRRPNSASRSFIVTNQPTQEQWLSAEQEKVLYEQARARAAAVQRSAAAPVRRSDSQNKKY